MDKEDKVLFEFKVAWDLTERKKKTTFEYGYGYYKREKKKF